MADELTPFDSILRRLDELSARLTQVEARLGLEQDIWESEQVSAPPAHAVDPPPLDFVSLQPLPPVSFPPTPVPDHTDADTAPSVTSAGPFDSPTVPTYAFESHEVVVETEPDPIAHRTTAPSLERLIGGKFYLIAGSIVVVLGVGLFLKLGYDAGWFRMTPTWKCLWGAAFGLGLLALGEIARRRVNALASAGISSAGMGTLFAVIYAAHGHYGLIGPSLAFVLLAAVTALGVTVAARAKLLSVAILSILGGYAAPFMLNLSQSNPYVLPLHLLALLATGLVLSGWRASPFRPLRSIVWWATILLGAIYIFLEATYSPELALMFLGLAWSGIHFELMWGADMWTTPEQRDEQVVHPLLSWRIIRPVGTSFSTTVWSVLFGIYVLRQSHVLPDWFAPAGVMVGAIILAIMLVGHLRVLRDPPETEAQRLGAGLAMQGAAMLIAVVALAFQGWLEVAAWLAVGVAATAAAAWIRSKGLGIYGVIILSIAATRLVTYDAFVLRVPLVGTRVLGLVVDRWTLLTLIAAAAWIAAAAFLVRLGRGYVQTHDLTKNPELKASPERERAGPAGPANSPLPYGRGSSISNTPGPSTALFTQPLTFSLIGDSWWLLPRVCGLIGAVLLFGGLIHPKENLGSLSVAWIALSMTGLAFGRRFRGMWLDSMSLIGLLAATAAWVLAYIRPQWNHTADGLVIHPGLMVCIALTAALVAAARVLQGRGPTPSLESEPRPAFSLFGACVILLTGVSLEAIRLALNAGASEASQVGWLCLSWIGVAALMDVLRRAMKCEWLLLFAMSLIGLALGVWAWGYLQPSWQETSSGRPLHAGLLVALALAAALMALGLLCRSRFSIGIRQSSDANIQALLPAFVYARAFIFSLIGACAIVLVAISCEAVRLAMNSGAAGSAQVGWLCLSWIGMAGLMVALGRAMKHEWLLLCALGLLELAIGVWAWGYLVPSWQATWQATSGDRPIHPGLLVALSLATALVALGLMRRVQLSNRGVHLNEPHAQAWDATGATRHIRTENTLESGIPAPLFAFICACALTWAATSFEIARLAKISTSDATVQSAAVSIWWGAVAAILLFFGFRKKLRLARYVGLGLLGVATVKAVVVDLADVPPIWRVASVLGLGLLMLAVAVVYAKVSDTLLNAEHKEPRA